METIVLTEASSRGGEKDALAKGCSDNLGFQGSLCPSQKCQLPPLYFWALEVHLLLDLQGHPGISLSFLCSHASRLWHARVQSRQQTADGMGASSCSLLPASFETSAFRDGQTPQATSHSILKARVPDKESCRAPWGIWQQWPGCSLPTC